MLITFNSYHLVELGIILVSQRRKLRPQGGHTFKQLVEYKIQTHICLTSKSMDFSENMKLKRKEQTSLVSSNSQIMGETGDRVTM